MTGAGGRTTTCALRPPGRPAATALTSAALYGVGCTKVAEANVPISTPAARRRSRRDRRLGRVRARYGSLISPQSSRSTTKPCRAYPVTSRCATRCTSSRVESVGRKLAQHARNVSRPTAARRATVGEADEIPRRRTAAPARARRTGRALGPPYGRMRSAHESRSSAAPNNCSAQSFSLARRASADVSADIGIERRPPRDARCAAGRAVRNSPRSADELVGGEAGESVAALFAHSGTPDGDVRDAAGSRARSGTPRRSAAAGFANGTSSARRPWRPSACAAAVGQARARRRCRPARVGIAPTTPEWRRDEVRPRVLLRFLFERRFRSSFWFRVRARAVDRETAWHARDGGALCSETVTRTGASVVVADALANG